jgi:hypothetical protein
MKIQHHHSNAHDNAFPFGRATYYNKPPVNDNINHQNIETNPTKNNNIQYRTNPRYKYENNLTRFDNHILIQP